MHKTTSPPADGSPSVSLLLTTGCRAFVDLQVASVKGTVGREVCGSKNQKKAENPFAKRVILLSVHRRIVSQETPGANFISK